MNMIDPHSTDRKREIDMLIEHLRELNRRMGTAIDRLIKEQAELESRDVPADEPSTSPNDKPTGDD